jgi:flagellar biosynthesis/type III secretory pathway chaperone
MMQPSMNTVLPLQDLENLCIDICALLEREHAVLRKSNGLIGQGVAELEALQIDKDREIGRLELMSKADDAVAAARAEPDQAQRVREQIARCKQLQRRNHQVFSRVVAAQRRIISVLRTSDDEISIYDRGGRTRDYGIARNAGLA